VDFHPILDDIMTKLNNLLQISNNVNKNLNRIIDRTVVKKSNSPISPVVMPVIKEFNERNLFKLSPMIKCYMCQGYGHVAVSCLSRKSYGTTLTNTKPFPLLLSTPIVVCSDQLLPLLLSIPSTFPLYHMLDSKSKFSTELIPITDQYQVIESASSFASQCTSHVHEQPTEISDKVAQK